MSSAFHDVRFPDAIARGAEGGPAFSTAVVETVAGREVRNADWSAARLRWNVATGLRRRADVEALIAFFRARMGRAHGFRFKDWSDFAAASQVLGTGDGALTTFQLVKRYGSGGVTATRILTRPVAGTVKVYRDEVEALSGWSVDLATGLVTFASPPADGVAITADCAFDVPVRFDTDALRLTLQSYELGEWGEIPVVELREP